MNSKINKMCLSKRLYITYEQALNVANRRQSNLPYKLYVYKCPICKGYHITKRKQEINNGKK